MSKSGNAFNMGCGLGESGENGSDISTLLHRDDSQLVLLVDPDEEGLLIVVVDSSALRPVSVEVAGIKETISLLKEEVVGDKLLLLGRGHGAEGIESTGEFTSKSIACLNDFLLNLVSLLSSDGWAKGEFFQITANSDPRRLDHSGVLRREGRALELGVIHVTEVSSR